MNNIKLLIGRGENNNKFTSSQNIQYGSYGDYVSILQTALNALGYSPGTIDGSFGKYTEIAVKQFQAAMGLWQDGIVGPKTQAKLNEATASSASFYDVSQLIVKVTWAGRKGSAPRTLQAVLLNTEQMDEALKFNSEDGLTVVFYEDDKELFQGLLMLDKDSSRRQLTIKAYDICIRFANNEDSFSYSWYTASQIFRDCCNRLGLPIGTVEDTGHVIGELIKGQATYWDVIEDALSQTYKTTGKRFYVYAMNGKVNLVERLADTTMPIISLDSNISTYDRSRSIENTRTRLKLVTSEGTVKNSTILSDLENKIGQFQAFESVDEEISWSDITQRVNAFKQEKGIANKSIKGTVLGDSSVISGGCVYCKLPNIDNERPMYVEEDTHTWEKGGHMMSLSLDYSEVKYRTSKPSSGGSTNVSKSYKVGDIVNFHGGTHYVSSYAGSAGYKVSAGPARIAYTNPGSAHPWSLITTDWSKTSVYGWVDQGTFD